MDADLFIKKMPHVVKELISREAFNNRRSTNQEAIALLEEALVQRVGSTVTKRNQIKALLEGYAESHGAIGVPVSAVLPQGPTTVSLS